MPLGELRNALRFQRALFDSLSDDRDRLGRPADQCRTIAEPEGLEPGLCRDNEHHRGERDFISLLRRTFAKRLERLFGVLHCVANRIAWSIAVADMCHKPPR